MRATGAAPEAVPCLPPRTGSHARRCGFAGALGFRSYATAALAAALALGHCRHEPGRAARVFSHFCGTPSVVELCPGLCLPRFGHLCNSAVARECRTETN